MWNIFKKKPKVETKPTFAELTFADVSHWETVNFSKYDKKVLFTKCTEGVLNKDITFDKIKKESKAHGLVFGAYHFFRANLPVITQAKWFLANAGNDCDFYILDLESMDGSSVIGVKQFAKTFLEYVERETGKLPILYSGHSFIVNLQLDESFTKYPLWLARYTNDIPTAPAPWKDWLFWQFSDKMVFNGIGECDGNVYNKNNVHNIKLG